MTLFRETIVELPHPTTEWEGARVRVTIYVPGLPNSLTSQSYIDRRQFTSLLHLKPPKKLLELYDTNPELAQSLNTEWMYRHHIAEKLMDTIAQQIVWALGTAIYDYLSKKENESDAPSK